MRAAIDLGTHSALLLVLDGDDHVLADVARVVGLGRDLERTGRLAPDRIDAAVHTLAELADIAQALGVHRADIVAVTTSAARRAANTAVLVARVQAEAGVRLTCIDGDEEGRLTWRGVLTDRVLIDDRAEVLVVDVGGGSTELTFGTRLHAGPVVSLEIGSVRLTERWLGLETHEALALPQLNAEVDAALAAAPAVPRGVRVVGVAGSVQTLVTFTHVTPGAPPPAVHGASLTDHDLADAVATLLPLSAQARRRAVPHHPERADFLVAGASILRRILAHAHADHLVASVRDLRWGLLS